MCYGFLAAKIRQVSRSRKCFPKNSVWHRGFLAVEIPLRGMEFLFFITSGGFNWLPICNISYRRFELLFSTPFPVGESPLFHHNLLPFLVVVVFCFPFRVFESPLPPLGGTCRGAACRGATCRGVARRCAGLASGCGGVVPSGLGGSSHVIPALA